MNKKALLFIVTIILVLGGSYYYYSRLVKTASVNKAVETGGNALGVQSDGPAFSYECVKGKTALELLKAKAAGQLEIKDTSYGPLVESVYGLKNGSDKRYWMYSVNGKPAAVGADAYKCQAEEVIEWRFSRSN